MDKIRCVIIDDELKARSVFEEIINRYFSEKVLVVGSADSVQSGVEMIKKYHPDLVFLDIEMPVESGFKLFDYFTSYTFDVIFTTAYKQYAIDAIRYAALDYLLKPINFIDLREALNRYEKKMKTNTQQMRIETLIANLQDGVDIHQKVALPTMDGYQLIRLNDIIYCESDINYTKIFTKTSGTILVSKTLKMVEELLSSPYFFRVHKSYLVNLNYIRSYSKSKGYVVVLENGTEIPVAVRKHEEFIQAITKRQ